MFSIQKEATTITIGAICLETIFSHYPEFFQLHEGQWGTGGRVTQKDR